MMSQKNEIALNMTEEELNANLAHIKAVNDNLEGQIHYTVNPREVAAMGPESYMFAVKAKDYMAQFPSLVPNSVNEEDFAIDLADYEKLRALIDGLKSLLDLAENACVLAGSEANEAARIFYRHVREAVKDGTPNAKSVYTELSKRFPGSPTRIEKK